MQAIRIHEHGGPETLKLEEISTPRPGSGEVLVRIHKVGLNFIDIYHRRGSYPRELPFTPGLEASGVVEVVAPGVTQVKAGDRVGYTGQPGAYAEYSVVKAESLISLPDWMDFEQGAAFPLQGLTAHYLINEYRKPKEGDTVLIHAAAGGMGLLLVQWAKHLGARVLGTVSTDEKARMAKEAGADEIIDYTRQDFVQAVKKLTDGEGVQLIIDGVGKTTFPGDMEAAAIRGTIVIFGSASGSAEPISPNALQARALTVGGGSLFNFMRTREEMLVRASDVLQAIEAGWLKLRVDRTLPLKDASEAHRLLEGRKTIGKLVLTTK